MSNKPRKKSTITLELTKEILTGDRVHLFVQGRKIAISGMVLRSKLFHPYKVKLN